MNNFRSLKLNSQLLGFFFFLFWVILFLVMQILSAIVVHMWDPSIQETEAIESISTSARLDRTLQWDYTVRTLAQTSVEATLGNASCPLEIIIVCLPTSFSFLKETSLTYMFAPIKAQAHVRLPRLFSVSIGQGVSVLLGLTSAWHLM